MFANSPGRWDADRIFPIVAVALVVVLVVGLLGVGAYVLLDRPGQGAPKVQAMTTEEQPTWTPWPLPTPVPSDTPTVAPTHTPVVAASPSAWPTALAVEVTLTPLATPALPTPTVEPTATPSPSEGMPDTGLGLFASAGLTVALAGVLWGARSLRRRGQV